MQASCVRIMLHMVGVSKALKSVPEPRLHKATVASIGQEVVAVKPVSAWYLPSSSSEDFKGRRYECQCKEMEKAIARLSDVSAVVKLGGSLQVGSAIIEHDS